KELGAELQPDALINPEVLVHTQVPLFEIWGAEGVASEVTEGSARRRCCERISGEIIVHHSVLILFNSLPGDVGTLDGFATIIRRQACDIVRGRGRIV